MKRAALIFSWTSIAELFANLSIDTVVLGGCREQIVLLRSGAFGQRIILLLNMTWSISCNMDALVTQHNTRVWHMSCHDTMLPLFSTIPPSKKILQLSVTAHYKIKSNNRYLFLNKS